MSGEIVNAVGDGEGFDTYATPIFKTKRFANMKEFVVPNNVYRNMRVGRSPGDKWASFVEDEGLRGEVRKAYHADGGCIVSCDLTGAAVLLKKKNRIRATVDDDGMGSGPSD